MPIRTRGHARHGPAVTTHEHGFRRGAKSPNPTPPKAHPNHHHSSERSTHTLSNATRSRKPRPPRCALHHDGGTPCVGRAEVYLIDRDGAEQQVCHAHGAALWLTDPTLAFASDVQPETIAAVFRHAFGGGAR
jgi:hypothetical protein